jgi:hypothetical protein
MKVIGQLWVQTAMLPRGKSKVGPKVGLDVVRVSFPPTRITVVASEITPQT